MLAHPADLLPVHPEQPDPATGTPDINRASATHHDHTGKLRLGRDLDVRGAPDGERDRGEDRVPFAVTQRIEHSGGEEGEPKAGDRAQEGRSGER